MNNIAKLSFGSRANYWYRMNKPLAFTLGYVGTVSTSTYIYAKQTNEKYPALLAVGMPLSAPMIAFIGPLFYTFDFTMTKMCGTKSIFKK